ncbi:MAG: response regulator, partial [Calditrichaeota bacterium]
NQELGKDLLPINGGKAQLGRALTNLILNASEAMDGMGVLTVKTENVYLDEPLKGYQTVKRGEYVKLSISDTGSGIDPSILDRIFDPFFSTKKMDRMRGSGLGLSIVHGVVEDHNGYLTVESALGKGTTFSLFFPITRSVHARSNQVDQTVTGRGERILVVDDDPIQRRVAGQLLRRLGYKVQLASSGEEAVERVKRHPQDLVVLDMVMEGIDGAETYRRILEHRAGQKAIILSGYAVSNRVEEALRLGAGAFVSKPISPNVLASAIRKELDRQTPTNGNRQTHARA